MGADIHLYVEKRVNPETLAHTEEGIKVVPSPDGVGKWVSADKISRNKYYDAADPEDGEPEFTVSYDDRYYTGRNYQLFGLLAGVRDSSVTPIKSERGLPEDVSDFVKSESDAWDSDGHSHSYFTLAELLEYDWIGAKTSQTGPVNARAFDAWRRHRIPPGEPGDRLAGIGSGTAKMTNEDMTQLIEEGRVETGYNRKEVETFLENGGTLLGENMITELTWEEPLRRSVDDFLPTILELCQLAQREGLRNEDVRITFWFDN